MDEMKKSTKTPSKHTSWKRLEQIKRDHGVMASGHEHHQDELDSAIVDAKVRDAEKMVQEADRMQRRPMRKSSLQKDAPKFRLPRIKSINTRPDQEVHQVPSGESFDRNTTKNRIASVAANRASRAIDASGMHADHKAVTKKILPIKAYTLTRQISERPFGGTTGGAVYGIQGDPKSGTAMASQDHDASRVFTEHEGHHLLFRQVADQFGEQGRHKLVDHILSHFHPEDVDTMGKVLGSGSYDPKSPRFKEEIANALRDLNVNRESRELATGMARASGHNLDLNRVKSGLKNASRSLKNLDESFFHEQPQKLAASELEKSRPRITFPRFKRITTRPDQEIHEVGSERQKKIFGRKVAAANIPDSKDVKRTRAIQKPDGKVSSKIEVEHLNHETGQDYDPRIAFALTEPAHRGKGLGTMLHLAAIKDYGKLKSDNRLSTGSQKVWEKLSQHPKLKTKLNPTSSNILDEQGLVAYPQDTQHEAAWKPKKLAANEFKKSSLIKGAMRRLAPWNKEARQTTSNIQDDLSFWQEDGEQSNREDLSRINIDPSSKKRTLHKLSGMTPTKVHDDGTRSFLLHRGMSLAEFNKHRTEIDGQPHLHHKNSSSWTPNMAISGGFASDYGRDLPQKEGAHVSAWVHENDIALMPNQHAQNSDSDGYKYEQEIIVRKGGISPLVHKDEVAKLTGVDKDDKYSHPGGKILDNPDRMINFRQQNQNQFGGDPVARNKYILPEFKRNRFKKSQLQKGVKQRLFPVKGGTADTPNPEATSYSMNNWQTHENNIGRKQLAYDPEVQLSPQAKARALHSLHGKTAVRRNKYGEREFLLHRGMGDVEKESALDIPSRQTMHNAPTSWTPNVETPSWFEGEGDGAIVSAWIPESAIKHIPMQLGHPTKKRKNPFVKEHEVIVHPGNYDLVHDKEVKRLIGQGKRDRGPGIYSLDQAINFRANPEVDRQGVTETYARQRRRFKKSQLAKSPIIHEQDDDFTYKTLDDNAFNEHFHEMVHEESLPNGLIHHIYQEKNSPDGIIHALSQGDPSQPVSLIAGYIEHKGPYKGYNAHLTATAPEHQGQGHGTLLKELATKRHGRMVSDATLSPAEDRSWQKLKRPDIDVKFGQRFVGDTEAHPDGANEAAQDAHIATYKKPLAASEFKKSSIFSK